MSERDPTVLVVDDDRAIRKTLRTSLQAHGYSVYEACTGEHALQAATSIPFDLILLDLGLPDADGKEITRRLREWIQTPIIILSVRDANSEKIAALDAGADDYLTKPFGPGELLARMRATRRRASIEGSILTAGDLTIDLAGKAVRRSAGEVPLTTTEYNLLKALILNCGRVLTDRQLVREAWSGLGYEDAVRLLRVNMGALRQKLEPDPTRPRYILTEPGVGYRFQLEG